MNAIAIVSASFVATTFGAVTAAGPGSLFFTDPDLSSAHYKCWGSANNQPGAYNVAAGAVTIGFNDGSVVYQLG